MTKWIDLYGTSGEYQSDVKNLTSDFDFLITTISHKYIKNDGEVALDMRVSFDNGFYWTDWVNINNGPYKPLFDGDGLVLNKVLYQYRVRMDLGDNYSGKSPVFDLFSLKLEGAYKIENVGDVVCKPEIWIKKVNGSGSVKLTNETNGNVLEIKNLNNNETVYIDCENEDIVTDLPSKYRYNDHNNVFIELEQGSNILSGEGDFLLDIKMQFKTIQG